MQKLQGIAVSPGVVIGEALVYDDEGFRIPRRFVARDAVDSELERLGQAFADTAAQTRRHRDTVARELGEQYAAIFDAHLQMMGDPQLRAELEEFRELTRVWVACSLPLLLVGRVALVRPSCP